MAEKDKHDLTVPGLRNVGVAWRGGSGSRSLIGSLDWGKRIQFQNGSLRVSLSSGLSSSHVDLSIKLLECPCDMAGGFPYGEIQEIDR